MEAQIFSASGKLLLFGEYLVLRGASSIVMPLRYKQTLTLSPHSSENIVWNCFEEKNRWLQIEFSPELHILSTSDESKAVIVQNLLQLIQKEKYGLKIAGQNFHFEIDFQRNYGFGTSSTFLSLLSQWSGVNPYLLLEKSFGGSGFDIAAATQKSLFVYKAESQDAAAVRNTSPASIAPAITEKLLFAYLGKKQKSTAEISSFKAISTSGQQVNKMNAIVDAVLKGGHIEDFELLVAESEKLISGIIKMAPVKEKVFADYPYAIKSLGAWGGDIVMATFRDEAAARNYFRDKGLSPIFSYEQLKYS